MPGAAPQAGRKLGGGHVDANQGGFPCEDQSSACSLGDSSCGLCGHRRATKRPVNAAGRIDSKGSSDAETNEVYGAATPVHRTAAARFPYPSYRLYRRHYWARSPQPKQESHSSLVPLGAFCLGHRPCLPRSLAAPQVSTKKADPSSAKLRGPKMGRKL